MRTLFFFIFMIFYFQLVNFILPSTLVLCFLIICFKKKPSVLEIQNIKFLWQNATFSFPVLFVKYLCWLNIWSPGVVIQISDFFVSFLISFYSTFLGFQFYLLFCFLLFLKSCFSYLGWFFFSICPSLWLQHYKRCTSSVSVVWVYFRGITLG